MHPLFNYINNYISTAISHDDFEFVLSHFIPKKIRKKQYLLQEGELCKHMAFIAKGAMRKYFLDAKGVEHVVDLYVENWWAGDRESFVMYTPSTYNIDAWEDCEVFLISRADVIKLCSECPAFNEFVLKLDERNNIATQKRITSAISLTSQKRYEDFMERHPYFVYRFPQHIIASYLGVTKDTLSRVRKKAVKK
ncbi:Crp/Fnr family transcriptional regulator [Sphingobacterium gobiense]|uniref:Cyclic nucleotide-binding protein n=1 Tax=Sphingobacterium gobiense TaxID=1382456 RepID=A0A2S9JV41_9SPHI|nr:Crp/Fnr family transcriptional regulator [Sphingobacterium gobiense]PRD57156.1 cyclic nucleotide-binding protein [Sphingobacterium gobiense]